MKKKCFKKIILGAITLILALICFGIWNKSEAADVVKTWDISANDGESNVTAIFYNDGKLVLNGTGKMKDFEYKKSPFKEIVEELKNVEIKSGITNIGENAFNNCEKLVGVKIEDGIISIGKSAFIFCYDLEEVVLPNSTSIIGSSAFRGCMRLKYINIPENLTSISNEVFMDCSNLNSIILTDKITNIGEYAFSSCKKLKNINIPDKTERIEKGAFDLCRYLKRIDIPKKTTYIANDAFNNCDRLESINVSNDNEKYASDNGVLFSKDKSVILKYPQGKIDDKYCIPNETKKIGAYTFLECRNLAEIQLVEGITEIEDFAFAGCRNITELKLLSGMRTINRYVFRNCNNLENIILPDGLMYINEGAFEGCSSLKEIDFPEGLKTINTNILSKCDNLERIYIPSSVEDISETLRGKKIKNIEVSENNNVYASENGVLFNKDKTRVLKYPAGNERKEYVIPDNVNEIGDYAFYSCRNLTNIVMPDGLTNIFRGAFSHCSNLKSINLPNSLTKIEEGYLLYESGVFYECSSLEKIIIPEKITSIGAFTFCKCTNLTDVTLPAGLINIGDYAFNECDSLTNINIPQIIISIGKEAFSKCNNLKNFELPDGIMDIGNNAFKESKIIITISTNSLDNQEIELPNIIKRANTEGDLLKSDNGFEVYRGKCNSDYSKITINISEILNKTAKIRVKSGKLEDLTVEIVPSGMISYSTTDWTNGSVRAIMHITEGERIINNDGNYFYDFKENGEFKFRYIDIGNVEKEIIASVSIIDKENPTISSVETDPKGRTRDSVTLRINAIDSLSGVSNVKGYSFDDGLTWQNNNEKVYNENIDDIIIKVKDKAGNIITYDPVSITQMIELTDIRIIKEPSKKIYIEGQDFEQDGMRVEAIFDDDTVEEINNIYAIDGKNLKLDQTSVNISYTENGIIKTVEQPITVNKKQLLGIKIKQEPKNKIYGEGTNFETEDMKVEAIYDNGKSEEVSNYEVINGENLKLGQTIVTISYMEDGVTKTTTQDITVVKKAISEIKVTKEPIKTIYTEGQNFESEGMVVTAIYNEGSTKEITDYTVIDKDNLILGKTNVTISYTENEVTKTTTQDITVVRKELSSIIVTKEPSKINYIEGEDFEDNGIEVTAIYNNGSTVKLNKYNYRIIDKDNLVLGQMNVTISYTENKVTKTTTQYITVEAKKLWSINITKVPTKTNYIEEQNFDATGMIVMATYNNRRVKELTNYTVVDGKNLTIGKTSVTISYTENGVTKTVEQPITVTGKGKNEVKVKTYGVIRENGTNYIEKIMPNTRIEVLKRNIETNGTVEIYKGNEKINDNSKPIGTGMEIVIKFDNEEVKYTVIVTGDLTGNGKMGIGDLSKLSRYAAGLDKTLIGAYLRASDVVKDGKYGRISDISKMSRVLAGMDNL